MKAAVSLSEGSGLERVNEHGEFRRGTFAEGKEGYKLDTFGKIFGMTRQVLVNDDLGVFERLPKQFGQMAMNFENGHLAKLLEANILLTDGKALFHAEHGNLASTGTALSVASLSAARLAMRRQKGLAGEPIAVSPRYLIVPPELETVGEQILATIAATTAEDANPFTGRLELLVESRLVNPLSWYLAADPLEFDGLEYAYLEGASGPQISSRNGFDVDGVEFKVSLDFGAGFIDHRGWFKNSGDAA